jgi:electron transport complex protein RnfB
MTIPYDHYKHVPEFPKKKVVKKKKPKLMAVVDEDNCTGCGVCVPFCPTECIHPVPSEKYPILVPPVQVTFDECIGCKICAQVCEKLSWDAIRMLDVAEFENTYAIVIH